MFPHGLTSTGALLTQNPIKIKQFRKLILLRTGEVFIIGNNNQFFLINLFKLGGTGFIIPFNKAKVNFTAFYMFNDLLGIVVDNFNLTLRVAAA